MKIDIVFQGGGPHLEFVEVETPDGRSLAPESYGGEWVADAEPGFPRLRIDTEVSVAASLTAGALRKIVRGEIDRLITALRSGGTV